MSSQLSSIDWTAAFIPIIEAGLVELLLYGIYVPLFATCVYILVCGRQPARQSLLLIPITVMFCLSTADIAVTFTLAAKHITALFDPLGQEALSVGFPKIAIYAVNNLIADCILLYRCYVIWESNVFVIIPPLPAVIAGTVLVFVIQTSPAASPLRKYVLVYGWVVICTNVYLTVMTAGRIWWVVRSARDSIHARQMKRYGLIIMAIIESGAIYSGCILVTLVAATGPYAYLINIMYSKIVCIMPALIIVQLGLGHAFHISSTTTRPSTLSTSMAQPSTTPTMLDTFSGHTVLAGLANQEISNTREQSPTDAV